MTGAPDNGFRVTQRDLYDSIQDLRKDNKEDLKELKEELLLALNNALSEFRQYRVDHAGTHDTLERTGTQALTAHVAADASRRDIAEGRKQVLVGTASFIDKHPKLAVVALILTLSFLGMFDVEKIAQAIQAAVGR